MSRRERGSEAIEMALIFLPLCGFLFLIMDVAWMTYARATLQAAAREGVRYAITNRTKAGMGQDDSIKSVVRFTANGLINDSNASTIDIQYFTPDTGESTTSNATGNTVQVSIKNFQLSPLGAVLHSATPLTMTAVAWDRMGGTSGGVPPAR
jgi:Flp pilus assembly protein TadG